MMRPATVTLLLLLLSSFSPAPARADEAALRREMAERELEIAVLQLRRYERLEYPLRLRRLESMIELTEAEVASFERQVAEYAGFDKFVGSAPLFQSLEQARLNLIDAQLRLDDAQQERRLLERHHADQRRLYALQIESAHAALARVEAALAVQ